MFFAHQGYMQFFQSNCALLLCWCGLVAAGQSGIQLGNIYFAGQSWCLFCEPAQNGTLVIFNYFHAIWLWMIGICLLQYVKIYIYIGIVCFFARQGYIQFFKAIVLWCYSDAVLMRVSCGRPNIFFAGQSGIPIVMPILRVDKMLIKMESNSMEWGSKHILLESCKIF